MISEHDIETYFSTNGLLLDDEILDVIVGKLTYLTVSVTGFTQETYHKNMMSDSFQVVKEKLANLNRLKKERGTRYPIVRISTVAMLEMLDELTMAVDFADAFDAEEGVQVTAFKAHGKDLVDQMPMNDPERFRALTEEAIAYAAAKSVKFVLQSGSLAENEASTSRLGHRYCALPWHRLSVQPNKDVYPCPMSYQPIGSLKDQTIEEIWNGEALATFRAGVNDPENMNEDCINCTHCRHRSLSDPGVNDFSEAKVYPTGMVRKRAGARG